MKLAQDDFEDAEIDFNRDTMNEKEIVKDIVPKQKQFPLKKLLFLVTLLLVFEFLSLVKGGPDNVSILGVKYCKKGY